MKRIRLKFWLILVLAIGATILAYPREGDILHLVGIKSQLKLRQGLDLQGGAHLVYQADMFKVASGDRAGAMSGLINVIERRVNPSGTNEVIVQTASNNRVIVELPGVQNASEAINLIGQTANLVFYQVPANATGPQDLQPTGITGKDINRADPDFDVTKNQPVVRLQLKSGDATNRFAQITTELSQSGGRLVTYLDQTIVFGPANVLNPITDGTAQLEGNFTVPEAKKVAQLINAGALPVPIKLVEQQTVGPTLGKESVHKSVIAGMIGLGVVALFMLLYYRVLGGVAVLALFVYTVLTLTLYKLSALTPYTITITLAGIAGFILSIGMAVDANILIFERMKEELRLGKSLVAAVEAGFDRAWTSIRDSNISTLITCVILYEFSGSVPIIKGFAVTLGLGVLVSLFTAVVISRTWLRLLIKTGFAKRLIPRAFGLKEEVA